MIGGDVNMMIMKMMIIFHMMTMMVKALVRTIPKVLKTSGAHYRNIIDLALAKCAYGGTDGMICQHICRNNRQKWDVYLKCLNM